MPIKILNSNDLFQFDALAEKFGSVFNHSNWLSIYDNSIQIFGVFDNDDRLIAGFHLYKKKIFSLTHITNPPYTPNIGLFYENKAKNKASALSYDKKILSEIADFLNALSADIITIAFPHNILDSQPFFWQKFKVVPNYTYQIDLRQTLEELSGNLSSDKRNSLNKSLKDNIVTVITKDYKVVEELVMKTFSRKNKGLNAELVKKILFQFANDTNSFAVVSMENQTPLSAAFCIYDKNTCYYLLGGYNSDNKHQAAGVASLWQAVIHAKELGLKCFDFEGSMLQEVERFFRGFGGDLVSYYTVNKARLPFEMGLKLIKRESF
ncbi:MAG: FemAB family protein [Bacteroidetes bacterium]|jgi:lipid II:glycine glycyltransferase (peptidoglycan interpeptide bridge formation enzyme)|nr:FemAB family protein [Bacteroidota bacterium]